MKITVIILTYNRPDALELILRSIITQTVIPGEVIIANDGSGSDTLDVINKFKKKFPVELKHVWQEDKGFRIAAIRNKAIKESTGDWLIFSDGDLIFHRHFFKDFKNNIKKGTALIGSRVFLKKEFSEKILSSSKFKASVKFCSLHIEKNRFNGIRMPFLSKIVRESAFTTNLRGGLMAVQKKDIVDVNGWNEDFRSWGKEDTELVARLHFSGIKFRKLKFAGITYHLWHPLASRSDVQSNDRILEHCITNNLTWCNNGLIKGERS